jgi:hypothetical protein
MTETAKLPNEANSECRALVPVGMVRAEAGAVRGYADAAFVAQLSAHARGVAMYRTKRRAEPREATRCYRTGANGHAPAAPRTLAWI